MERESRKICCMFDNPPPTKAELKNKWEWIGFIQDSEKRRQEVHRCRKCGAYVLYDYEEISCYWPGYNWDDLDIYHRYYSVDNVKKDEDGNITYDRIPGGFLEYFDHYYA